MQFAIYKKTFSNWVTSITLTNVPVTFHCLMTQTAGKLKLLAVVSVCDILKAGWGDVATSGVEK